MNQFSDLEHLELVAQRIAGSGKDITDVYGDWIRITFACASLGESAREAYHRICANYMRGYSREECDRKFDNCLRTGRGDVTIASLIHKAKEAGIDVTWPKAEKPRRGRPRKTEEQREAEKKSSFEAVSRFLCENYEFAYNVLSERLEVKTKDGEDRLNFDERMLNSILTKLHQNNVRVSKENLSTYINSNVFSATYNPVKEYCESLKRWGGRTDYIRQVFDHLHLDEGCDREFLYECFRLWYVDMVAVGCDMDVTNQLILVLAGEKEGTGKTEFFLQLLPPPLRQYIHSAVQLSNFRDKDEALATAHNLLFFLDEIQLNRQTMNKLKNMVGGAGASTVTERAPFAHSAEVRRVRSSFGATTNHLEFIAEDLGSRRFLVLPVVGSEAYDDLPTDKAFAQAYFLATHPKRFSTKISAEMMQKLKSVNEVYVQQDINTAILPTVLRAPRQGEQAQAVVVGEIISWLTLKTGPNREFTAQKVNAALKKLGFTPKKTNRGNVYIVRRLFADDVRREGERIAKEMITTETEAELPF